MSQKIAENLQNMCMEILQLNGATPDAQLIAKIEYVYEQALLLHFLEERKKRSNAIGARVEAQLQELMKDSKVEISTPADESPAATNYMSEVKILPHPEGPPKPTKTESSILDDADNMQQIVKETPRIVEEEPKVNVVSPPPAPVVEEKTEAPQVKPVASEPAKSKDSSKSINAKYATLNIGLNDRIAFVKHLFAGSAEDYNRVLSQLNTMDDLGEMEMFIADMVKPEYNWEDKEEYEERFMAIVRARFS